MLFLIHLEIYRKVTQNVKPLLYADETTLFTSINSDSANSAEILNNELQSISDWLKLNKLSLNIGKAKAIIFHTPQKKILYPNLYIDVTRIEFVNKVNFLGLIIDEH